MSCHECYIRFIIIEPKGRRPEGEVIISLRYCTSGHDITNIFHDFKVMFLNEATNALHNNYKHVILKLFKKLTTYSPVLSMTKLILCSIAWGYNYVIIIIHNLVYICGYMDASS